MQLGDTLKHSSILIYSTSKQSIYTQNMAQRNVN
jgi:hypothetical protein